MIIMEFIKKETNSVQHLNTKGCCFLCLETEEETTEAIPHLISIRYLLRHLQITSFEKEINKKDIKVDLCKNCEHILMQFTAVLEELEKVQMKMNYFLELINKTISGSKKDLKRIQVYSKRMTDDSQTLAQLAFVDNLRKKLEVKSLKTRFGLIPQINLEKTEVKKKVKEEVEWTEELNATADAEDVSNFDIDDQDSSEFTASASPFSEPPPEPINEEKKADRLENESKLSKHRKSRSFSYKKIAETGMYQCKKCEKLLQTREAIFNHYQSVHLKQRFKCEICNISSYAAHCDLKVHQKTCRETLEERLAKEKERKGFKFVCDLCGKRFEHRTGLNVHRFDVHKSINRYACDLCDKTYTKLCSLKEHKDSVHLGKVFYCRFCKKRYSSKSRVCSHEKRCNQRTEIKTESEEK